MTPLEASGGPRVVAVGGGHGLATTLRACRSWAGELTAIVSVADDGGSSGVIRAAAGLPAVGDLRRCVTALAAPEHTIVAAALERRFDEGVLAGHPPGNLLLAALAAELGDLAAAVDELAAMLGTSARIVPATAVPVDLVAHLAEGGVVRGQVAVEAARGVERVILDPDDPPLPEPAAKAVAAADFVLLGPGSLYGSICAALAVPGLRDAIAASPARVVLVCNLRGPAEAEDAGVAGQLAALARHGVEPELAIAQHGAVGLRTTLPCEVLTADVARPHGLAHDPVKLGDVLRTL